MMTSQERKPIWIAGPCAVESKEQVWLTAQQLYEQVQREGMHLDYFRAGVWKPRSHPDSFEGLGEQALPWLAEIQAQYGVPVCVEVLTPEHVALCERYGITTLWVGARTGVNPVEVQKIADAVSHKPFTVLVKNPLVADLKLWAGNVERFLQADIQGVMAVHRGFTDNKENVLRNAPCWEIPIALKVKYPELPILCDPSHLCGDVQYIPQTAQIALSYGFDGLMTECHPTPEKALSDAGQQLTPAQWAEMVSGLQCPINLPDRDLLRQRALLENVDHQLSQLLWQRMQIVDDIARIKQEKNMPVVQPHQWQKVVERYHQPEHDELYNRFLDQFLPLLHQHSILRQQDENPHTES
ncbi:MAG: bifunctional 3-deoxy-7-phosphoheptulonate synthase/chorismate mutase type II [Bacteroidales bacterium]|nr:bifunctional 3-deoxy-7-phosphoheptulonate synthase/chorismate mutase type II [Bacteroidales bacterium]